MVSTTQIEFYSLTNLQHYTECNSFITFQIYKALFLMFYNNVIMYRISNHSLVTSTVHKSDSSFPFGLV